MGLFSFSDTDSLLTPTLSISTRTDTSRQITAQYHQRAGQSDRDLKVKMPALHDMNIVLPGLSLRESVSLSLPSANRSVSLCDMTRFTSYTLYHICCLRAPSLPVSVFCFLAASKRVLAGFTARTGIGTSVAHL
jgi:hypothetical protein